MTEGMISQGDGKESKTKPNLRFPSITKDDLISHLRVKFGSLDKAYSPLGLTKGRFSQILRGWFVPVKPETIKRYADSWDVDIVALTRLFEDLRNKNKEKQNES